jgi:RNA polymerase sigma factor (sigma-70 family)
MPIGDDFEGVLAAAQRGEGHAFEIIYRDLAPLVLGYLRSNGSHDPEDLTSEVFVAMVRNVSGFSGGEAAFRSWVLTIAHRRLIDEFRLRSRRPEDPALPDDVQAHLPPTTATAESQALDAIDTAGVSDALSELTPDQRAVVTLRILADVPIKEVAAILGKPETSIKSLQHRALATLSRNMKAREEEVATRQYPDGDHGR